MPPQLPSDQPDSSSPVKDERSLTRRNFLGASAAGAASLILPGCGGGSSSGGGGGSPGGAVTFDQRLAAMDAISTRFAALPHQDPVLDNQTLYQYLQTRSEFDKVQYNAQFGSLSAHFKGGQTLVIVNNRPYSEFMIAQPAIRPSAPVSPHDFSQIPSGKNALLFNNFGSTQDILVSVQAALVLGDIKNILSHVGYTATSALGTLYNLKNLIKDAAVVHVEGHGTFATLYNNSGVAGLPVYCLPTATGVNLGDDSAYKADLDDGSVGPALAPDLVGKALRFLHNYYITSTFVQKYWTLNTNSFVYLNTCMSNADFQGSPFRQATTKPAGGVYAGWDGFVLAGDSTKAAEYLYNSLAGQNNFGTPKNPPQRPFDWSSVLTDMHNKHLDEARSPQNPPGSPISHLMFSTNLTQTDTFGLLAPSIRQVYVSDTLYVEGEFGTDPGAGLRSVTLGGVPLTVVDWAGPGGLIQCSLPAGQPDLAGPCVVTVRGHTSNTVRLTFWKMRVTITHNDSGSLYRRAVVDLHVRCGVAPSRSLPTVASSYANSGVFSTGLKATAATSAQISAGGTYLDPMHQITTTWSVNGPSKITGLFSATNKSGSILMAPYDSKARAFTFSLYFSTPTGLHIDRTAASGNQSTDAQFEIRPELVTPPLVLGADYSLPAFSKTVPATFPTNPDNPDGLPGTYTLSWPQTAPVGGTAPDPSDAQ